VERLWTSSKSAVPLSFAAHINQWYVSFFVVVPLQQDMVNPSRVFFPGAVHFVIVAMMFFHENPGAII
jgi:hypothetical protein